MRSTITADDVGKEVVHGADTVGRVVDVEDGTAYVDPDLGIAERIESKLGWTDRDDDAFALHSEAVEAVTDDEVRVGLPEDA